MSRQLTRAQGKGVRRWGRGGWREAAPHCSEMCVGGRKTLASPFGYVWGGSAPTGGGLEEGKMGRPPRLREV